MEIANGYVTTCPENTHHTLGITPAEAVILKLMHNQYSNGSPLKQLVITGEATQVNEFGKPLVHEKQVPTVRKIEKRVNGKKIMEEFDEMVTEYTPSIKPRTNEEEINRLKRKYVGNIPKSSGGTQPAFVAAFGESAMIRLPQTFEEVRHIIGDVFTDARPKVEALAA